MTPLWKIEYGEGSSAAGSGDDDIEHDLEAATPKEAMLKFLLDQTGLVSDDTNLFSEFEATGAGMEEMSIEEIAEHLTKYDETLDQDRFLSFYRGDDIQITVWYGSVKPEDTIICPRCEGHGRIDPLLKI